MFRYFHSSTTYGYRKKLSYKKDIPKEEAELLRKELLECANISANLDVRMEEIKNRIVNK